MKVSACNRIEATIADMKKGKATTSVRLQSELGDVMLVVTSSSVEALELELGNQVSALFREVFTLELRCNRLLPIQHLRELAP